MTELRINKGKSLSFVIVLITGLLLSTVWPLGLYKETIVYSTGETVTGVSPLVGSQKDSGASFIAEEAHLQSIDVYVQEMPWEGEMYFSLYDIKDPLNLVNMATEYVEVTPNMVPGFVSFIVDIELDVERAYTFIITGGHTLGGVFRMGYVNDANNHTDRQQRLVHSIYYDSAIEGESLIGRYTYRVPIGRRKAAAIAGGIALVGAALWGVLQVIVGRWSTLKGDWTIRRFAQVTFSPLILAAGGSLLYAILVPQIFDRRLPDMLAYSLGTLLTMAVLLYGLWRRPLPHERQYEGRLALVAAPEWLRTKGRHYLISAALAFAFAYACEYINGLYDISHAMSVNKMLLALAIAFLFTLDIEDLVSPTVGLWIILADAGGLWYYLRHKLPPTEKEFAENNFVLKSLIWIAVLTGVLVIGLARRIRRRGLRIRLCAWLAVPMAALFLSMCICRYGRWWPVTLTVLLGIAAVTVLSQEERRSWTADLGRGLAWQFAAMVGYSLMHRLYLSFNFIRFPLAFHTVTQTAVYLTAVIAVAASMLFVGLDASRQRGYTLRQTLSSVWKEMVFFGVAIMYLLMTMSRTGILATGLLLVALYLFAGCARENGKWKLHWGLPLLTMFLGFVLMATPVFAMQRMLPALRSDPMLYEIEEPQIKGEVLRGDRYDSSLYICVERFAQVLGEKMLGWSEGNTDTTDSEEQAKKRLSQWNALMGTDFENSWQVAVYLESNEVAETMTTIDGDRAFDAKIKKEENLEEEKIASQMEDEVSIEINDADKSDYTNGRGDIFRYYLAAIGLRGHEQMGLDIGRETPIIHAHNIYLQSAYDHGAVTGVLLAIFLLAAFLRAVLYNRKVRADITAGAMLPCLPLAATVGFAASGLVEWVFHLANPLSLLFLLCVIPLLEQE